MSNTASYRLTRRPSTTTSTSGGYGGGYGLEYKPLNWLPNWEEILDKPLTFAPSAHTHAISEVTNLQGALDGKLGKTEKAVDSDLLDGVDSYRFFYNKGNVNLSDVDTVVGNGAYNIINGVEMYRTLLTFNNGSNTHSSITQLYGGWAASDLKYRMYGSDRWDNWKTIWNSGNSNLNTVDWNARTLYSGATVNCQASMSGGEGNEGSYASWTNYKWYNTEWRTGIRRGGSTNYKSFSISKNDDPFIEITDTSMFFRNRTGIGCFAGDNTTLAIGDSDTGFQWISDGLIGANANGVQMWNWNSQRVYFNHLIQSNAGAEFRGNVTAGSQGEGNCFFRPACDGYSWNNGYGALTVDIRNNGAQTPLLLARREGSDERLFSVEQLNDGSHLYIMQRAHTMIRLVGSSNIYLDKNTTCAGNLLVKGGTTGYTLDSIVFDEPTTTTRSNTSYQSDQQQEALYLMSSEIQQLRTENADLKRRLDALEGIILNNKQ